MTYLAVAGLIPLAAAISFHFAMEKLPVSFSMIASVSFIWSGNGSSQLKSSESLSLSDILPSNCSSLFSNEMKSVECCRLLRWVVMRGNELVKDILVL